MSDPVKVFTVIALISLPTVMFGGYSLLRLLVREQLNEFQRTYFRAGHAHAGVLLVLTLVSLTILNGTDLGTGVQWVICLLFLVGVLAQSGGMFVHMARGAPGRWSVGNSISAGGAGVLAVALLWVAYGVIIT
jgi:heme/copper-type cytochrome/quinol oxidase subunit 4